jgi:hypothetical protein
MLKVNQTTLNRLTKADINGRLGFAVVDSGRRRGERRDEGGTRTSQLMTLGTKFVALPSNGGGPREA